MPPLLPPRPDAVVNRLDRVRSLPPLDRLVYWVGERESVRLKKEVGAPPPWTDDPILQRYRFCNCRRMDDKVSRWLVSNWYGPYRDHPNMLAAVALARFVNRPEVLAALTGDVFRPCPTPAAGRGGRFPFAAVEAALRRVKAAASPVFGGAYVVSGGPPGRYRDKVDAVVNGYVRALVSADSARPVVDPSSMSSTHANVKAVDGYASFMAGQVVADLRWALTGTWADRNDWAPMGPGSQRGLNRLVGNVGDSVRAAWHPDVFADRFAETVTRLKRTLPAAVTSRLEAHDYQNCLCEFDKYERALWGEGRPKQVYPGGGPARLAPRRAVSGGSRPAAGPAANRLRVRWFGDVPVRYRRDSSDENVIEEVLERRCYARARTGFDVEAGETWLDLGANIGAFALYCASRGAAAVCFEPDEQSYRLLVRNTRRYGTTCHNSAVTAGRQRVLPFWPRTTRRGRFSAAGPSYHRGTVVPLAGDPVSVEVANVYAGSAAVTTPPGGGRWGGVKMDVEGSEGTIIDAGLVPPCEKLVVEYHLSRDRSSENLRWRLAALKGLFRRVDYPAELDRLAAANGTVRSFADRTVRCTGWLGG